MSKFRKKPIVIEALQFFPDQKPWPKGVREYTRQTCSDPQCRDSTWDHDCELGEPSGKYYVWNELHKSKINLQPGDWVRQDDPKDYYPIAQAVFNETFEPVEE